MSHADGPAGGRHATAPRSRELAGNWRIVAGGTLGLAFGVHSLPFYTAGLFVAALERDFGWSRTALSLGVTAYIIALGLASPIVGLLSDRYREQRLILAGLVTQAAALAMLSQLDSLIAFYALMGGMALLGAGCATPPYLRIVNRTFSRSKGLALGIVLTGAAGLSAIAPPLVQSIISGSGWRSAYLTMGAVVIAAAPLILLLLAPSARGQAAVPAAVDRSQPGFDYRDVVSSPAFIRIALAIFLVAIACTGLVVHFAPMLADAGLSASYAAAMIGTIGITQVVARLGTGFLIDRYFAPRTATIVISLAAGGFLAFAMLGPHYAIIGAVAAGLAFGAESDLMAYLTGRYFPTAFFGRIFGLLYTVFLAGTALSPLYYGAIVDQSGGYRYALLSSVVLLVAAAGLFRTLPRFPEAGARTA